MLYRVGARGAYGIGSQPKLFKLEPYTFLTIYLPKIHTTQGYLIWNGTKRVALYGMSDLPMVYKAIPKIALPRKIFLQAETMISTAQTPTIAEVNQAIAKLHIDVLSPGATKSLISYFSIKSGTVRMSSEMRRSFTSALRKVVKETLL